MDVLSLISTKGGAGKTTVAANLGGVLADAGLRVLLLDLDSQPTLSSYYTVSEARVAGSYELIAQRLTAPDQVISATVIQHLDLIVSNDRAGHISTLLLHAADGRLRLRNLLPAFEDHYDMMIIDTQGARSVVVEMVILASACALCPVPPEMLAARELRRGTLGLFEELEPYRYLGVDLPSVKLLLNQVNANRRETRLIMQSLQASFQEDPHVSVCRTVIPDRVAYPNAASLGLPVHRVEPVPAPGSRSLCAAEVMRRLAIELFPQWAKQIAARAPGIPTAAGHQLLRRV
ncbi:MULTISPECIES: ParA family protein [Pseudomonas]|uniref:ParA family protein n=1 Tax=Pseudomonas TaxID=286 RepID=UPI000D956805|nr:MULTISPECIES: ParA family protein [Pseudomonas]MBH3469356.1 ParA family protein [Pseudomonas putida]MDG9888919.1 ParA family protein [Pseudomonas juntendi]PYC09345.1 cobyrinic acid a,c-diamide synthase [Pseudomonas sp. MB-090624]